ncbi:MAG: hypothetical protein H6722_33230 [Sandaracinus sp.]|nr:hypothetical protein [Sandaracinus sp.]
MRLRDRIVALFDGAHHLSLDPRLLFPVALGGIVVTSMLLWFALRPRVDRLAVSGGDALGWRHALLLAVKDEARPRGLELEVHSLAGSTEALGMVERGELDAALVQGGLAAPMHVREAGALGLEALHLLVRRELPFASLDDLRGHRVDVGPVGSGTHVLAHRVLAHAGLRPNRDVQLLVIDHEQLTSMDDEAMPDAIFHVSGLPSPLAESLVRNHGYRLVPVPFGEAFSLRHPGHRAATIPIGTYDGAPVEPADAISTIGTRTLLVVRAELSDRAVRRLVEATHAERVLTLAGVSRHDAEMELEHAQLPLHEGARDHLERDERLLNPETIDNIESLRSFFVSLAVALFLLWRWWRARMLHGFEDYLAQVTALERDVLSLDAIAAPDLDHLIGLRRRLGELKTSGLSEHAEGRMASDELLTAFLLHVGDVRDHLDDLILHARERLEKKARREGGVSDEDAILQRLWNDAMHDEEAAEGHDRS